MRSLCRRQAALMTLLGATGLAALGAAPAVVLAQTTLQPAPPVQPVRPLGPPPTQPPMVQAPVQPGPPLAMPATCAVQKDAQARAQCAARFREIQPVTPATQPQGVTR